MSALFNFNSFLTVVLLVICTCTYIKIQFPAILNDRTGFRGFFWKAARIVQGDGYVLGTAPGQVKHHGRSGSLHHVATLGLR
ncbi:protein kish-A-like [Oryza brachyantha]|uniref:protein kish-A-like n=1 Tax=Oryza brachyantha TaxID=4533 RepID=UPI0007764C83|nr:protein kish-A-like [Oryza brachyantha]